MWRPVDRHRNTVDFSHARLRSCKLVLWFGDGHHCSATRLCNLSVDRSEYPNTCAPAPRNDVDTYCHQSDCRFSLHGESDNILRMPVCFNEHIGVYSV